MPELTVKQLYREEIYRDIIRIHDTHRTSKNGNQIKEGKICIVSVDGAKCYAIMRGYQADPAADIHMDENTRAKLGVALSEKRFFQLKECGFWGQLVWAWTATEVAYQVATRLAVLGLFLGVVGIFVALPGLFGK